MVVRHADCNLGGMRHLTKPRYLLVIAIVLAAGTACSADEDEERHDEGSAEAAVSGAQGAGENQEALLLTWARAHPNVRPAANPGARTTCPGYPNWYWFSTPQVAFAGSGDTQLGAVVEAMRACTRIVRRQNYFWSVDRVFEECANSYDLVCRND